MLPNHSPLIVAEQFGTLASLYPGRIDLGLGRAPGTDQTTARALRRDPVAAAMQFPEHVRELQTYLSADNKRAQVRAIPGEGLDIPVWILGSSTDSAYLAAALGLPYAFASHFAPRQLQAALQIYRQNFRPSEQLKAPYTMACINVIAADKEQEAQWLATSFYQLAVGILRGTTRPLQPPLKDMSSVWHEQEEAAVRQMMAYTFIGDSEKLRVSLHDFLQDTAVDELMVVSHIFDHEARLRSYELLARLVE